MHFLARDVSCNWFHTLADKLLSSRQQWPSNSSANCCRPGPSQCQNHWGNRPEMRCCPSLDHCMGIQGVLLDTIVALFLQLLQKRNPRCHRFDMNRRKMRLQSMLNFLVRHCNRKGRCNTILGYTRLPGLTLPAPGLYFDRSKRWRLVPCVSDN